MLDMKSGVAIIAAILISGALAWPRNALADDLLTSDLVAWSSMQQPTAPEQRPTRQQPTPEPSPETSPAQTPTPQPGATQPSHASAGSQGEAATTQTFTGLISKEPDGFTLKVSQSTSYKLDNQREVQQYQGRRVRVTGTLDPSINLIHVDRIEPLS